MPNRRKRVLILLTDNLSTSRIKHHLLGNWERVLLYGIFVIITSIYFLLTKNRFFSYFTE